MKQQTPQGIARGMTPQQRLKIIRQRDQVVQEVKTDIGLSAFEAPLAPNYSAQGRGYSTGRAR